MPRREPFRGTAIAAASFWTPLICGRRNIMSETHSFAPGLTVEDVQFVSPALAHYMQEAVMDGVWKRPELSPRDRSLITVAALIARSQTLAMPHYFEKA